MNNKVPQNQTSSDRTAEGNSACLEVTQRIEFIKNVDLVTSNESNSGPFRIKHDFVESPRKRTRSSSRFGDQKRSRRGAEGSACVLLASIEEQVDASSQSIRPHDQQQISQTMASQIGAGLVTLDCDEGNDYIDKEGHRRLNEESYSTIISENTRNGATHRLQTTNGCTVYDNGGGALSLEIFSSSPQEKRQSSETGSHKQIVHKVSANGDCRTGRIRTAQLERAGPKCKQPETNSLSSDGGTSSNGLCEPTEVAQNPYQAPKKIQQNTEQKGRLLPFASSTSYGKTGSYSDDQSTQCKIQENSHNVKVVDFRSDTCSLPTEPMRDAIYRAEVGDAVYNEDPSVLVLEKKSAKLFQKEAACFVPSGTMSNLVAILVHCNKRGSEIITGSKSHILLFEQAGVAQFGGINIREIENNPDGTFSLDELKNKIRIEDAHTPYTSLICVENTHNVLGGKVLPQKWIEELCTFAKSVNLPVHMDGARIFSASIKLNISVGEITRNVDTVTFCISKNLGAPYGSVLLGSTEFITKARRVIKALGGGVRQIGFMAAAGLYALENMVERLSDDHYHVQMIADGIRKLNNPHVTVLAPEDIHTNILMIRLDLSKVTPVEFVNMLSTVYDDEEDPVMIRAFAIDKETVRFVLCNNNSKSDVEDAIRKIRFVINKIR